jgi:KaiC/GvpD/RAD55 family RecA-like ATPase
VENTIKAAFPDMSSILMVGSPGIGMLEFNISLTKNYLDQGDSVVFVAVDNAPEDILAIMRSFGIPTEELLGKSLFVIDFHSNLLGACQDNGNAGATDVRRITDLEGIMFNISDISASTGRKLRIFLYSLSTLFLYNQSNVVLKFFQISCSRIRSQYGTAIVSLHDGVHDDKTVNHLMAMADGVIELKFDEELNRRMRIRHMKGYPTSSQWIPFEIRSIDRGEPNQLLEWR